MVQCTFTCRIDPKLGRPLPLFQASQVVTACSFSLKRNVSPDSFVRQEGKGHGPHSNDREDLRQALLNALCRGLSENRGLRALVLLYSPTLQFRKDRWFCPFDALSWANTSNSALHLLSDRLISLMCALSATCIVHHTTMEKLCGAAGEVSDSKPFSCTRGPCGMLASSQIQGANRAAKPDQTAYVL